MKKILVMGLPGSGKSTLSKSLNENLTVSIWFNADKIRKMCNDWDFSIEGRIRQAHRMKSLINLCIVDYVIMDFVAPLIDSRTIVNPDFIIWMNTIPESRYTDTNSLFHPPLNANLVIENFDYSVNDIVDKIKSA